MAGLETAWLCVRINLSSVFFMPLGKAFLIHQFAFGRDDAPPMRARVGVAGICFIIL